MGPDESWLAKETPICPVWNCGEFESYGETNVGQVRDSNQDSFAISNELGLFLVADGVGGQAGGELASQMAVQVVQEEVRLRKMDFASRDIFVRQQLMAQSINTASLRIFERALEWPQYRGMGTTLTALCLPRNDSTELGNRGIVAHVGDSRCYLLRCGFLYQLTDDHSFINEQIKLGRLKATDPIVSQIRNVITRCVGNQEEEEVDTRSLALFSGDRFLLCSDGLYTKVRDSEISSFLASMAPEECVKKLITLANERGGDDNITVIAVHLK